MTFDNSSMGVQTRHPEYNRRLPQWDLMYDLIDGEDTIKEKGERYLPAPSVAHKKFDDYERKAYEAFKERAPFTNFTAQIKDCLHGMLEYREAKIDIPASVREKGILSNIDLQGNTADQFFSDITDDVLVTGFGGILADLPHADSNISLLQAEQSKVRPYLVYYKARSIINWKYRLIGNVKQFSLVVLEEEVDSAEDEFSHKTVKQYRVLKLNERNECVVEIHKMSKGKDGKEIAVIESSNFITLNGKKINFIPFVMLPFSNPVKPILYDIAKLNIHHYQVGADYQNGAHLTSRPTGWFTGHEPEVDPETDEPIPVCVGTDVFWQIPEADAKVGVCTFSGEGIEHLEKSLDRYESQIITLGSHIISAEKKTAENKDTIALHRQGEDAKLATYGRYLSYRYTNALKIICEWCGCSEQEIADVKVTLNTDFSQMAFDANAVNSIANIFSQGKLPLRCLYYLLQSSGYLEPNMAYEDFIYLLDLEAAQLAPTEVDEAYKIYKQKGIKKDLGKVDWYSPDNYYTDKSKTDELAVNETVEEDKE
jgi:hypothetical protein